MIDNLQAKLFFELEKVLEKQNYRFPKHDTIDSINLMPKKESYQNELFTLDINRKSMSLNKITYQKRVRQNIVLRRLDFNGGHRNPELSFIPDNVDESLLELMKKYENEKFSGKTHIHFYIEGYGEKWAFPLDEFGIISSTDILSQAREFCKYCNINPLPTFYQGDLFDV